MVIGEVPFKGDDSIDVMAKQVMEALSSSEMKNRRISRHMHYFIERMMSKDKDLRYSSPAELVENINEHIEGFRSLEYQPDVNTGTSVMSGLRGDHKTPPPGKKTTRRITGTKRFGRKKLDAITKRFKKPR